MAEAPKPKPVSAWEPALLFIATTGLAALVLHGLATGWVWIPGSRSGSGGGYWLDRAEDLGAYMLYLVIVGLATLGVLAMAIARLRRFNEQKPAGR